eukprot:180036_1
MASSEQEHSFDYDIVVIGGGSGGISCARQCAKLGAKTALFDFVKPSPHGSSWGLGGTCVNVGCIPKKIMHYAGILGASLHDAEALGWKFSNPSHDWETMVQCVQNHVKSLNWGYRVDMMKNEVKYIKALARFEDTHAVSYTLKGQMMTCTAKYFVIATGGRPNFPDIPGAKEHGISSDDVFSLETSPGKTLLVGASYISLETAGFLTEMSLDVTVAVRSILLRGFDQEIAERIGKYMKDCGTKFHRETVPMSLERQGAQIKVVFKKKSGEEFEELFDTVMFATGRRADTAGLNLGAAGVKVESNGKIECQDERTNVEHIFAIGDVLNGRAELTPVAIHSGLLLAKRLFSDSREVMDHNLVPTTVFTPIEYGSIGLSEEDAIKEHGEDNIETYLSAFNTLEHAATHRATKEGVPFENPCLIKLVCLKPAQERVIGFHYIGPNAGEVTQGFALGMRLGATKADFESTIGIHPTAAENFTTLRYTRSSGESYDASGC